MERSIEAAFEAIIKTMIENAPDMSLPDALTQNLLGKYDEFRTNGYPAEADDVERLARYAQRHRNDRLNPRLK